MLTFESGKFCRLLAHGAKEGGGTFFAGSENTLLVCAVLSGGCRVAPEAFFAQKGSVFFAAGERQLSIAPGSMAVFAVLEGEAPAEFCRALSARALPAAVSAPPAALVLRLHENAGQLAAGAESALCYELVCSLAHAAVNTSKMPALAEAAVQEMRENYAGFYGVEELAGELGVSKNHLIRVFTKAVGVSPGKYLTSMRVEAAKRFLLNPGYSLEMVAGLCGFAGANYFCRVFRRETGMTPGMWRVAGGARAGFQQEPADELYL